MRWTKAAIRKAVEDIESIYGCARWVSRFDPLEELVSCILSQHTTDATSFPTFAALRKAYPSWKAVAALPAERLAKVIARAGLPNQKARSIIGSLSEIYLRNGAYTLEPLRELSTEEARKWLLSLPGVGPKTGAIVLCFSFGRPAIPVDTHVFRVSWRLGLISKELGANKAHAVIEKMVPEDLAFRFHTALIQHGRQICKAPTPQCHRCPLTDRCKWFRSSKLKRDG
ncbi:MAG: endonuclease III domain-containing protein [Fimbriimonadales bacterium]